MNLMLNLSNYAVRISKHYSANFATNVELWQFKKFTSFKNNNGCHANESKH